MKHFFPILALFASAIISAFGDEAMPPVPPAPPTPEIAAPPAKAHAKVLVVPLREQISSPELYILRRGIKQAIDEGADSLVIDMETPGGALDVTFEMLKALEKFPGKTYTYVNREAISAGALIAAGTDEIYFAPEAVIGAAAPVLSSGGEIDETMRQKIVSYLKARVRAISEGKAYRGQVVSAMIDQDVELKIGEALLKPKGELLSLTASEAVKTYGDPPLPLLGAGISPSLESLLDGIHGAGNYSVRRLEVTWSEELAQILTAITPVLMGLGLLALFIEFKTPGFGIFGIAGLTLIGIVFFGQFTAGLSGHEPALFFALGVVLVLVDLFLFPGSMVMALCGACLMFGSLTWALVDHWPGQTLPEVSGDALLSPMLSVLLALAIAVISFLLMLKFLPKGGPWTRMVLQTAVGNGASDFTGILHQAETGGVLPSLIGCTGRAVTALFPSGQIEIAGNRYEARLDLGFAEAGTPVKVTGKSEFGWKVEVLS